MSICYLKASKEFYYHIEFRKSIKIEFGIFCFFLVLLCQTQKYLIYPSWEKIKTFLKTKKVLTLSQNIPKFQVNSIGPTYRAMYFGAWLQFKQRNTYFCNIRAILRKHFSPTTTLAPTRYVTLTHLECVYVRNI